VDRAEPLLELSVVVPAYGCADSLDELVGRLRVAVGGRFSYELLLVDDGDVRAWRIAAEISEVAPEVVAVKLTRNFGQHAAITAGVDLARGRYVAVLDGDLEDPPELVPEFLGRLRASDASIVFGRRAHPRRGLVKSLTGRLYFRLAAVLSGQQVDGDYSSLTVVNEQVVETLRGLHDVDRHWLFMLRWSGYPSIVCEYVRDERRYGESSYGLRKLLAHGLAGLAFQSTRLLQAAATASLVVAAISLLAVIALGIARIWVDALPGWTSLVLLIALSTSVIVFVQSVVGMYVARVLEQVRGRPLYVVERIERGERA
jgi:dolichol-phosphate mannosyltransferase